MEGGLRMKDSGHCDLPVLSSTKRSFRWKTSSNLGQFADTYTPELEYSRSKVSYD